MTSTCSTPGATIRYTTDGSEPTQSSTLYISPIPVSTNTTIKAKAFKAGWLASDTATAEYVINLVPANFVLVTGGTFNNGTSNVTLSSFYIDNYEVTQASYQTVIGTNPSQFAGKGGNQSQNYTYSGSNSINAVARYSSNSSSRTWDVGGLAANELGNFDMSGNVWEWCWDIYGNHPSGSQNNPMAANSGSSRVLRGGSWFNDAAA